MTLPSGRQGIALLAAAVGVVLIALATIWQWPDAPEPGPDQGSLELGSSSSASPSPSPSPSQSTSPSAETPPSTDEAKPEGPLARSTPVSISIPAIDVTSSVIQLGTAKDGTLAVPQPGPDLDKAAWFENSPTPGQPGPSVIEGHVSTAQNGPSIFFDLAKLKIGDEILVDREDGTTVVFTIHATREFDKDKFPTKLVYGGDLSTPTLRLVTCSSFDPNVGHHTGNLVVFAELTDVRR